MSSKIAGQLDVVPYIPSSQILPEANLRTFVLGIFLAIIMAGSNAYLVLKLGACVSACIPAAVISMGVLKFFKDSNILQNNIVQTVASAGEAIAGTLAMVLPAMILIGYWDSFPVILTSSIVFIGGGLGVLITIPLRRAMIVEGDLKFPEGVATAEVLKAGDKASEIGLWDLIAGGLAAAFIKFAQTGWQILADSIQFWSRSGNTVYGTGGGFSLAIIGAGYIIGFRVSVAVFLGAFLAWYVGIPVYSTLFGVPAEAKSAYEAAVTIWDTKLRIIGVGAMVFGGIWTTIELIPALKVAVVSSLSAIFEVKKRSRPRLPRTENDIPIVWVAGGSAFFAIPLYITMSHIMGISGISLGMLEHTIITILLVVISYLLCFLAAAISSYMCGLMGATNNPISGTLIMSVLILSFFILVVLGPYIQFNIEPEVAINAAGIVIFITSIVAGAGAIAGDNMQDLKSGQLVGSTPWIQQVMLLVGVLATTAVITPVFQLLFEAYGIGDVLPREGMDPSKSLSAPKAALLAALAEAVFTHTMDWTMIGIGICFAIGTIILDKYCIAKKSQWRFPVLAVAVGIYMPIDVTFPSLVGGIIAWFVDRSIAKQKASSKKSLEEEEKNARKNGVLFASGMIAGEAMVGIFLAIPFVVYQSTDVFKFVPSFIEPFREECGFFIAALVIYWFYRSASNLKECHKKN